MKNNNLPVGDIRQVLSAMAESRDVREFLEYRIPRGKLKGHPLGNLLLGVMQLLSGDLQYSADILSEFLQKK